MRDTFVDVIEKLIAHWRNYYLIEPVLILTLMLCFIVALFRNNREKERLFFLMYFFIGTSLFVVLNFLSVCHLINGRKWIITVELANTVFELSEFIAFYYFFKKCLLTATHHKILKALFICFCVVVGIFFAASTFPRYAVEDIRKHSLVINVIELFFIFCMCLAYYYDLFTAVPKVHLFQRPSFFITTSTFFYSVLLIPFLILANEIMKIHSLLYHILFSVHFVLLIIMLVTILKAFLWRKPITT
jgi:hypothetical protein